MNKDTKLPLKQAIFVVDDSGVIDILNFRLMGRDWSLIYTTEDWIACGGKENTYYFNDSGELLDWLGDVSTITKYKSVEARWFKQQERGIDG